MLTDDPETPGAGVWEINGAYTEERTDQQRAHSFPHIDVNYGLGERIQLKYETGWAYAEHPSGTGVESGVDNSLFGFKWRFLDRERAGFDLSVYPQLEVVNSDSSVARGVADPGPNLLVPLEFAFDLKRAKLVAEVGYQYRDDAKNEWVSGLLAGFDLSDATELLAELRSVGTGFLGGDDVILNVGLRQKLSQRIRFLAALGTGLTHGEDATTSMGYVGVQFVLE